MNLWWIGPSSRSWELIAGLDISPVYFSYQDSTLSLSCARNSTSVPPRPTFLSKSRVTLLQLAEMTLFLGNHLWLSSRKFCLDQCLDIVFVSFTYFDLHINLLRNILFLRFTGVNASGLFFFCCCIVLQSVIRAQLVCPFLLLINL